MDLNRGAYVEQGVKYTLEEFKDKVRTGECADDTGVGVYANNEEEFAIQALVGNFYTDRRMKAVPETYTHVVWYSLLPKPEETEG